MTFTLYRAQKSFGRVNFMESGLFNSTSANKAYTRINQRLIFANQTQQWLNEHDSSSQYIARGHFSPVADFVYGTQQTATFYYANVAPQWQTFNIGNWFQLESAIRKLSINNNLELTVYTGTHGIYKLNRKDVFLTKDKFGEPIIPVPLVFWKVVYNRKNSKAVAFIGLNDPDADPVNNPAKKMCIDVCDSIKWVNFKPKPVSGLMYCCAVEEFSKIVKTLPPIANNMAELSLLDYTLIENDSLKPLKPLKSSKSLDSLKTSNSLDSLKSLKSPKSLKSSKSLNTELKTNK